MKLKTKVLLLAIAIHGVFIYILTGLYNTNRTAFLIGEATLFISLILTYFLYQAISLPFDTISSGIESLKDKDFSAKLNTIGHPEMDELIYVYNLMIDQLRQERLLQVEKSSFLGKLIEASPSGIVIFEFDGIIASVNPAAAEIFGIQREEALGKPLNQIAGRLPEELLLLTANEPKVINLNGIKSYKCHKATFTDRGYTRTFITIEELSREIYLMEKNAYEKVIKMMSHEVNNSIGAINSLLNSCLNYKNQLKDDDQDDYENALNVSIGRNNSLSNLMSNFARVIRVPEPILHPVDLTALLRSVALLMEPEARKKQLTWLWETDTLSFEADADDQQMEQVFINIFKNAIEAANPSGSIRIQISSATKTISIGNTGPGISNEVSRQLFSPFFSTTKNGQGIGLMLTREILYHHHFKFSLQSNDGWTEFKITV